MYHISVIDPAWCPFVINVLSQDETLLNLSMPPDDALDEIENLLQQRVLRDSMLDHNDLNTRKSVVDRLNALICQHIPGEYFLRH